MERLARCAGVAGLFLGAGAAPDARAAQAALLQGSESYSITNDAKVFCVGPNKAGTMALDTLFLDMPPKNWAPCHNVCEGSDMWSSLSQRHDASHPAFQNHRAFMDNGDSADFEWLDTSFPGSRFVLNTRAMHDWVLSRFDMVRADREMVGCTPQGTTEDCPNVYAHWGDNTDEDMLEWIVGQADHQQKVLDYFNQDAHRRQRFAMIDVEGNQTEALMRLHWVTRTDTSTFQIDHLLNLHAPIPEGFAAVDNYMSMQAMPDVNKGHHDDYSHEKVTSLLRNAGCTPEMDYDQTYAHCADLIRKKYHGARLAANSSSMIARWNDKAAAKRSHIRR